MVLPCVPAIATPRRPAITAASAAARRSTRSPRRRASTTSGLVVPDRRRDHDGVDAGPDVVRRVSDVDGRRRGRAAPPAVAESARVAAGDRHPAGEQDPGDAAHAGAADADEVHAPSSAPARRADSEVTAAPRAAASTMPGQRDVGVPVSQRRRPPCAIASSRGRVGQQRHAACRRPLRRAAGVVDQQPAAGRDHRLGVEPLLAVADRQRHVDRRQADRGQLGAGHAPRGTAPGRPPRRPGPSGPGTAAHVGGLPGGSVRRRHRRCAGPAACSTWTPAAASARRRPRTAALSRRAPCEPPETSSVGRSGSQPERGPALAARAARSRVAIDRRSGMPDGPGAAQRHAVGGGGHHVTVSRAPSRLASPGRGVRLVHHDRHAAPAGGEVGRRGHVAAEADHHVGLDPLQDRPRRRRRHRAAGRAA